MTFSDWVDRWINQIAHVGYGALIACFVGAAFGLKWGALAEVAVSGLKEFAFDPLTETPQLSGSFRGDAEDFAFFSVGGIIGLGLAAFVRHHLGV